MVDLAIEGHSKRSITMKETFHISYKFDRGIHSLAHYLASFLCFRLKTYRTCCALMQLTSGSVLFAMAPGKEKLMALEGTSYKIFIVWAYCSARAKLFCRQWM